MVVAAEILFKNNTRDIMRYCNNWFNRSNTPEEPSDPPAEFLELAERILLFREAEANKVTGLKSESIAGVYSYARYEDTHWTALFKKDLEPWKRLRRI